MFIPTSFPSAAYDTVERDRVEHPRPASRLEVLQHQQRASRHQAIAIATTPDRVREEGRPMLHVVPDALDGIRRSISRALIHAGQRIGPEAA